jgi:hypothetical protein
MLFCWHCNSQLKYDTAHVLVFWYPHLASAFWLLFFPDKAGTFLKLKHVDDKNGYAVHFSSFGLLSPVATLLQDMPSHL